jgi:hypothetical protein
MLAGIMLLPPSDWHYSSDGDLRGTQTKYIEAKHILQVEEMNEQLDIAKVLEEHWSIYGKE